MALLTGADRSDVSKLQAAFPASILGVKVERGETYVCVARDSIVEVVRFLKEDAETQFDYFVECVGVDYLTWRHSRDLPERFEVVYNLFSVPRSTRLFLKVGAEADTPIPSLVEVFLGAEYPEREIADLFGVTFEGNGPHPGRFLLPDDWVGFPLRKDVTLGGEDIPFDQLTYGPAVEDVQMPHAGESFEGRTGTQEVGGR